MRELPLVTTFTPLFGACRPSLPPPKKLRIICATGFDVTLKPRFPIIGARGQDLATQWDTIPEGYMGLAAENMPNYFSRCRRYYL